MKQRVQKKFNLVFANKGEQYNDDNLFIMVDQANENKYINDIQICFETDGANNNSISVLPLINIEHLIDKESLPKELSIERKIYNVNDVIQRFLKQRKITGISIEELICNQDSITKPAVIDFLTNISNAANEHIKGKMLLNNLQLAFSGYFNQFVEKLENQIKAKQNETKKNYNIGYNRSRYSNSLDEISDAEEQNPPKRSFLDKIKIGWNGFWGTISDTFKKITNSDCCDKCLCNVNDSDEVDLSQQQFNNY